MQYLALVTHITPAICFGVFLHTDHKTLQDVATVTVHSSASANVLTLKFTDQM